MSVSSSLSIVIVTRKKKDRILRSVFVLQNTDIHSRGDSLTVCVPPNILDVVVVILFFCSHHHPDSISHVSRVSIFELIFPSTFRLNGFYCGFSYG